MKKDSNYWKNYNLKRKDYLAKKQQERRIIKKSIQPKYKPTLSPSEIVMEKVKELLLVYQNDKEQDKVLKAKRYHRDLVDYLIWVNKKEKNKTLWKKLSN